MDEQVIERVRKLLALATSTNPHEAALAAERALEIAQRHNLDLARIHDAAADPYLEQAIDVGGASAWRWLLMSSVARAHFCRALRRHDGRRGMREMFVIGERHNLRLCEFLFVHLAREIERLTERGWRRASLVYGEHVRARAWKEDFRRGAVATIGERLAERTTRFAAESSESRGLVQVKETALLAALERLHPDLPTHTLRRRGLSDAYDQGRRGAREIQLTDALAVSPLGQPMLVARPTS